MSLSWRCDARFLLIFPLSAMLISGCNSQGSKTKLVAHQESSQDAKMLSQSLYDFDDKYTYHPDSILDLIWLMGLCDSVPVCDYDMYLVEPCHKPDGSHYRCWATKEMTKFYLL